jgi:ferritin
VPENHAAEIMLNWFVTEQVEERPTAAAIRPARPRVEGDGRDCCYCLTQELESQRVFVLPAATEPDAVKPDTM